MRRFRLTAVAAAAALALSMPAFAAQAKPAAKPAKAAKTMTVSGTLQKVEGQDLTIQTTKGTEDVMLAPDAKIRRAGQDADDQRSHRRQRFARHRSLQGRQRPQDGRECDPGAGEGRAKAGGLGQARGCREGHEEVVDRHVGCCTTTSQSILRWRGTRTRCPAFFSDAHLPDVPASARLRMHPAAKARIL